MVVNSPRGFPTFGVSKCWLRDCMIMKTTTIILLTYALACAADADVIMVRIHGECIDRIVTVNTNETVLSQTCWDTEGGGGDNTITAQCNDREVSIVERGSWAVSGNRGRRTVERTVALYKTPCSTMLDDKTTVTVFRVESMLSKNCSPLKDVREKLIGVWCDEGESQTRFDSDGRYVETLRIDLKGINKTVTITGNWEIFGATLKTVVTTCTDAEWEKPGDVTVQKIVSISNAQFVLQYDNDDKETLTKRLIDQK